MTEPVTNRSGEHKLLAYRVDRLEESVGEIRDAVKSIDKSLQLLSLIEAKTISTHGEVLGILKRVHSIENELPTLKLARKWVLAVMTSGGAAVGAAVFALPAYPRRWPSS